MPLGGGALGVAQHAAPVGVREDLGGTGLGARGLCAPGGLGHRPL